MEYTRGGNVICKCGGQIKSRLQEEGILYCDQCGVVMDEDGNVINGVETCDGDVE